MSKTKLFKKAGVSAIALTLAAGLCVPVPSLYAFAEEAAIEQVDGDALDDESANDGVNTDTTDSPMNDDAAVDETVAPASTALTPALSLDESRAARTAEEADIYDVDTVIWMIYTWFKDDYTEQEIKLPEGEKPVEGTNFTALERDGVKPVVEIRDDEHSGGGSVSIDYNCESTGSGDAGTLTLYFTPQKAATQTITFSYYGLVGYETVPGGTGPGGDYPEHEEPIWEEISPSVTTNDIIEDDGFYDGSLKWATDPETGEYKQIPLPDIFIEDIDGWEYSHCLSVGDRGQGRTMLYYTKKTDTPDASEYTYDLFYEDEEGNKLLPGTEITTADDINDILAGMDMPDIDGYTFLRIEPDEESPMWVFHAIYKKNPADETPADPDTPETPGTPSEGETPDDEPLIETGTTPPSPQEPQETIENDPVPEAESLVQTGDTTPFIPVSVAALASLAALATAHIARKKND